MKTPVPYRSRVAKRRRGIAVVELAVCLPVLALILLATVETCVMLQLQQNLAVAAYEGTRIGIMPGADSSTVELQCEMLLDDRGITGYTIATNPIDLSTLNVGDTVTTTVAADCAPNSVFGGLLYENRTITESVAMRAE